MTKKDFVVGNISFDIKMDSVIKSFGLPKIIDTIDVFRTSDFLGYHYDGFIVWADRRTHEISSFDISKNEFMTQRGLKVGDSINKLIKLYGKGESVDELHMLYDIYDVRFKDYTKVIFYEYHPSDNDAYTVFFYIKHDKVVRIFMYHSLGC